MTSNCPNLNNNITKNLTTMANDVNPLVIDLNKIESKFKEFNYCLTNNNDNLCQFDIDGSILECENINESMTSIKDKWGDLIKRHRDIHTLISKFGKTTDKIFNERIDHLNTYFVRSTNSGIDSNEVVDYVNIVNSLIFDYLLRIGCVDVARAFIEEEGVKLSDEECSILNEVSRIISSMRENNFVPLKEWINGNQGSISENQNTKFMYTISKLEFLHVLSSEPDRMEKLIDSAKQMAIYARFFQSDFEYVMGSLAFIHSPERIRQFYAELFVKVRDSSTAESMDCDDSVMMLSSRPPTTNITKSLYYQHYFNELESMYSEQVCAIKQCTHIDPLFTLFSSGMQNITEFFNHDQIFKKLYLYNKIEDLPLTVKKHNHHFHHSIFHCPVDKAVASGDNSILKLKCGHAISKSAYNQLTKNEQRTKMKCPYCPIETKTTEVLKLIL